MSSKNAAYFREVLCRYTHSHAHSARWLLWCRAPPAGKDSTVTPRLDPSKRLGKCSRLHVQWRSIARQLGVTCDSKTSSAACVCWVVRFNMWSIWIDAKTQQFWFKHLQHLRWPGVVASHLSLTTTKTPHILAPMRQFTPQKFLLKHVHLMRLPTDGI